MRYFPSDKRLRARLLWLSHDLEQRQNCSLQERSAPPDGGDRRRTCALWRSTARDRGLCGLVVEPAGRVVERLKI